MGINSKDKIKYYLKFTTEKKYFLVIFITVLSYFTWFFSFPLFGPILSHYLASLKLLAIEKGRFIQVFLITLVISSILSGFIIDKLAKRVSIILISSFLSGLVTLVFFFIDDLLFLLPISFLLGIIAGFSPPAIGAFFADHTFQDDRGRILGVSLGFSMLFAFIFIFGIYNWCIL